MLFTSSDLRRFPWQRISNMDISLLLAWTSCWRSRLLVIWEGLTTSRDTIANTDESCVVCIKPKLMLGTCSIGASVTGKMCCVKPLGKSILLRFCALFKRYEIRFPQYPLQWCHNERDGVSNHQPHDCLLNYLFRHRSKKTSMFRVTGLCAGNSPVTGVFPAQRASNAENVSIWWRHHASEATTKKSSWIIRMNSIPTDYIATHYDDVIMMAIASQITSLTIVYSNVYSGAHQRKHQSSASLAFVRGIHRGPVNSPHKWPVTRKMFPFDDVIMTKQTK